MRYRPRQAGYVGVDPDALSSLAELLDDAALELRGCASIVGGTAEGDAAGERVHVLAVAEWAEQEANDLRRRSTVEHALGLLPPPFGGSQHGKNNRRISDEQRAQLQAAADDKTLPDKVRKAAQRKLDADEKVRHQRQSRQANEDKTPPVDPKELKKDAEFAGAGAASGMLLWWLGKLAAPLCGPAVVICAVVE